MKLSNYLLFILISLMMISCMKDEINITAQQEEQLLQEYLQTNNISTPPTPTGLYFIEEVVGTGDIPRPGDSVLVNYTGYFIDGVKFDSSYDRNKPFGFRIGTGYVIEGWDEGIGYMHEGGEATLVVPSSLGYGEFGVPGIPPYSTLIFEVKLISIID